MKLPKTTWKVKVVASFRNVLKPLTSAGKALKSLVNLASSVAGLFGPDLVITKTSSRELFGVIAKIAPPRS